MRTDSLRHCLSILCLLAAGLAPASLKAQVPPSSADVMGYNGLFDAAQRGDAAQHRLRARDP